MFCSNCGEKLPPEAEFCPNCGAHEGTGAGAGAANANQSEEGASAPVYSNGGKYLSPYSVNAALSSNIFLGITILVTIGAFFTLFAFSVTSLFSSVFPILFSVSLWLGYAGAKAQNSARVASGTKMMRGVIFAQFICVWVATGIIAVCAIVFMAVPSLASSVFWDLSRDISEYFDGMLYYGMGATVFFIAASTFLLTAGFLAVENLFYTRNAEKLARSVNQAAVSGAYIAKARVVRIWLMVLGILACLSIFGAFSGIGAFMGSVGSCCLGASMILSSVFISRYFE